MSQQITKNQHYVPQFLLNHFGWDAKKLKRINIFDTARATVRYNQAVKEVFSQNYFYDKDNSVENLLSNDIEAPAAAAIDKSVNGQVSISGEDRPALLRFISALLYRTPQAKQKALSFINSFLESVVEQSLKLNGLDSNEAAKGRIEPKDPGGLVSMITLQGIIDAGMLIDLDFHIIKNNTTLEFCISDHPAFSYNWLYRDLEHPAVTSLTAKGLQIFLPLSPHLLLCLYDTQIYKYGKKNSCITEIFNAFDVEILNSFQIINSESIIGFNGKKGEASLRKLYTSNKEIRVYQHESSILEVKDSEDGELKTTHIVLTRQTKFKRMPSFVKKKNQAREYASSFHERNPALSAFHQNHRKQILKGKKVNIDF